MAGLEESEVGVRLLKQNASAIVARAEAGEVITVTLRGRPAARLTKVEGSRLDQLIASGQARSPLSSFADFRPPVPGPSLSDELERMRSDERW